MRAAALRDLFVAHGGLSFAEVQARGHRLASELQTVVSQVASEVGLADVTRSIEPKHGKVTCNFGRPYHTLSTGGGFAFTGVSISLP